MSLLNLLRRKPATREPSPALTNMRSAVDRLHASVEFLETAIEAGEDARLSCRGITLATAPEIGTAHQQAATDIKAAMLGCEVAVSEINAVAIGPMCHPDEKPKALALLRRVLAIQSRMADCWQRAGNFQ